MSRLLLSKQKESEMLGLVTSLKKAEQSSASEKISITKTSIHEVVELLELLIREKPIVLESALTPNDAAEILGVSRNTVTKLIENGQLHAFNVNSHRKIPRESLQHYLDRRNATMNAVSDLEGFDLDDDE